VRGSMLGEGAEGGGEGGREERLSSRVQLVHDVSLFLCFWTLSSHQLFSRSVYFQPI